ncbi:hypothetical protein [Halochromatium sp.]
MDTTRIASLLYPALEPQQTEAAALWSHVGALRMLVRRHLPPVTASLFARAHLVDEEPGRIEWYSDLAGEPIPFEVLPDPERAQILALVSDRLASLHRLADELDASADAASAAEAANIALLRQAARYPHPSCIYLVAGEPVLTYWGLEPPRRGSRDAKPIAERPSKPPAWRGRLPRLLGATVMLMLAVVLGLGAWHWHQQRLQATLAAELAAGLAAQCEPTAMLQALQARLARIDPDGERFPEIRFDTERELNRCADAEELETLLSTAHEDCSALPNIADALAYQDTSLPPFDALQARLSPLQARCALAEDLHARRRALDDNDCNGLLALAREVEGELEAELEMNAKDRTRYPVAEPIGAIATAAAACAISAELQPRVAQANGDCGALRALERELGQRIAARANARASTSVSTDTSTGGTKPNAKTIAEGDVTLHASALPSSLVRLDPRRAPLAALIAEIDAGLERCALADQLTTRLAEAQGDCVELASLREIIRRQGHADPPFEALILRVEEASSQCSALTELEARFVQAQDDCAAVAALDQALERWRDNLRFVDIRARVDAEQAVCAQASAFEQRITAAGTNCDTLRTLSEELGQNASGAFAQARQTLKAKLARCAVRERLTRLVDAAGTGCTRLKAAERELAGASGDDLGPLRQRLAKALEPCRPKPKPEPGSKQQSKPASRSGATPSVAKAPRGAGTYALSGACQGNLVISPAGGYHGDRVRHIVTIAPPVSARIGKVVSDNRGCRNCRLNKRNATTWSVQLYYGCSGRGSVPIAYSAYDQSGKLVCSGRGTAQCLGRRRP